MLESTDRTLTIPATPTQESVWWVHQRAKNKSLYNLTWRLACDRPVDFDALRIAWQAMVDRHDALRTSVTHAGTTIQLTVHPCVPADLGRVEVDDAHTGDEDTLLRLIAEEVQEHVVNLDRPSLARLTLVRVADRYELLLTVHHVVLDGWGVQLLLADLSEAYAATLKGREPDFAGDPVPFHVYADELRAAEADGHWRPSLDYWCSTLEGASATTIVADRQTAPVVGGPGVTLFYRFSNEASAGIRTLSKLAFATPFATVLGALGIVLARGGAGPDVSVGVVAANRITARDQKLVGYTANLCIARATIADADKIADVMARSRDAMWSMLAHQAVPYPAVFGALSPATQRTLSDAAPILLSYLGSIGHDLRLGEVELRLLRTPNRAARADMAMSVSDVDGGHRAEIEFSTARYDEDTVTRLLRDVEGVLAAGGSDPGRTVGTLEIRSRSMVGRASIAPREEQPAVGLPGSGVWERVDAAWATLLGSPPSGPDADFFAAGGHSLSVVRLAAALESEAGIEIDVVDWLSEPTPRRIVAQLSADGGEAAGSSGSTVIELRPGSGPHLHLVPGAGGGVHDYRDLLAALPEHWRVTLSQEREPLATIPIMAERYRADLDAAGLRPDVVGGWSMGGQVAFEIASGLKAPMPALVVLDSTPPLARELAADLDALRLEGFAATVCGSFGVAADRSLPRTVGDLELHMGALAAHLACAGHEVSAGLLADRWRTYDRHARAGAAHVAQGPVGTPALIVGAALLDVQLGQWATLVGPAPRILRVDTDHHGVLTGQVACEIAAAIVDLTRGPTAGYERAAG
jgi:thioesterase domain-containing protein